jgi:hypothetical protein
MNMVTYKPRQRVPFTVKFFIGSVFASQVAVGLGMYFQLGFASLDKWGVFAGAFSIAVLLSLALLRDTYSQLATEVTELGFTVERCRLGFSWPFVYFVPETLVWSGVKTIHGTVFAVYLNTNVGKRTINLMLFEKPDEVGMFIHSRWVASRQHAEEAN